MLLIKRSCQKLVRQKGKITIIVAVASFLVAAVVSLMPAILIGKKQIATTSAGTPRCKTQDVEKMEGSTCKNRGEWCVVCVERQGPCPSDSGMAFPFQCVEKNGGLVWQNQNRLGECNTTCAVSPTPGSGASPPVNKPPAPSSSPVGNSCFTLSVNFEARPPDLSKGESGAAAFYAWVTFNSQTAGDVKLDFNNQHLAGWNGFAGGSFTYSPQWTQPYTHSREAAIAALEKGRSFNVEYTGWLRNCDPQTATIRCNLKVDNKGVASVSGGGCSCSNCGQTQPVAVEAPTPTLKPITPIISRGQKRPAPTPTLRPKTSIIKPRQNKLISTPRPTTTEKTWETFCWPDITICRTMCGGPETCEVCKEGFSNIRKWQCKSTVTPTNLSATPSPSPSPIPSLPVQQELPEDDRIITIINGSAASVDVDSVGMRHSNSRKIIYKRVKITLAQNETHTVDFSNEESLKCNDITANRVYAQVTYKNLTGDFRSTPEVGKRCGGDVTFIIKIP